MKKLLCKLSGNLAALALTVVMMDVNSACSFVVHQPKLPAEAVKLSKING